MNGRVSSKNGGPGTGWAATWKSDATPVHEQIEVTSHSDPRPLFIPGRLIGWQLSDGRFIAANARPA
jgi:hypothetical protein